MSTRIGLTGDVMLGRLVNKRQKGRTPEAVWGGMLDPLHSCDFLLMNLECCLSTRGTPWNRTHRPFHFRADPDWAIPALTRAGVDACALANNHVLDFEVEGLADTLAVLDAAGIGRAGAGHTLDEALEPCVLDDTDFTVAVVSFTDNTPEYAADETRPGTAHIEIDVENERTRDRVTTALDRAKRTTPDLVIASLHWGPNMVAEPPRAFERFGRWLVDSGVDVVHGHSAHNFQAIEVYDGSPILYDTGDFVDDYAVDGTLRNDRSFLFRVHLDDGTPRELRLSPTEIMDCAVHPAGHEAAAWSRERMQRLSEPYGTSFETDGEDLVLAL